MNEQITIPANAELHPSEDYTLLRAEGIRLIEKLGGKVWTDYNTHDPGITLLEALCYALTDLGYRTSFDIEDILASGEADAASSFYLASQILRCAPVTVIDYRKLIIDTRGVKNAWVEVTSDYEVPLFLNPANGDNQPPQYALAYDPVASAVPLRLKGLYKVLVEYEEHILKQQNENEVESNIRRKLKAHRNLCEDFVTISSVEYELFAMEAEVQVNEGANIEKINAQIWHVVQSAFSPAPRFYTLQQMLDRGYSMDEIFEGPALKHGFLDERELEASGRNPDIHLSDVINSMLAIDGVIAVRKCLFPVGSQSAFSDFTEMMKKEKLSRNKILRLDTENSVIEFSRRGDRHRQAGDKKPDRDRVKAIYSFLQSQNASTKLQDPLTEPPVPAGRNMDIAEYYPFQFSLPTSYGLKEQVVSMLRRQQQPITEIDEANLTPRQKQILQLKGFLMVFEQVMANYLSQLAHAGELNSFGKLATSFFSQQISGIADVALLFASERAGHEYGAEDETGHYRRRHQMLDHLLARFGEDMSKYAFYCRNSPGNDEDSLLQAKSAFLKDYIQVSNYRGAAVNFNEHTAAWNTDNVPGVKKRVFRSLGMQDYSTRHATCNWIDIELRKLDNGLERYVAVVRDPADPKHVLLESNSYETASEARHVLTYILQHGASRSLYYIDDRAKKLTYQLTRKNTEGVAEAITIKNAADSDENKKSFEQLIDHLNMFTQQENLHIAEHILLRPQTYPVSHPKQQDAFASDEAQLLSVFRTLPAIETEPEVVQRFPFRFKVARQTSGERFLWNVSVQRNERIAALTVDVDFTLREDAMSRVSAIREAGADKTNYALTRNADGYYGFSIAQGGQPLATGRYFREEAERNAEIDTLVDYFSFELNLLLQQDGAEEPGVADYADPYSCQVSVFIPNWPRRFSDPSFRYLLEKTIRQELPAHIYAHISWLDYGQMKDLENVYKPWLEELTGNNIPDTAVVNQLVNFINTLRQEGGA